MNEPFRQPVNPYANTPNIDEEKNKYLRNLDQKLREQIVAVFANPHGMQLLDTLEDFYLRQPVCPPGCVKGYGYKREGENSFIIKLRAIVNNAQKPVVTQ
jgi:hypothetical protein